MRQNPHVRICGGPGSATTLVYPTSDGGQDRDRTLAATLQRRTSSHESRRPHPRRVQEADGDDPRLVRREPNGRHSQVISGPKKPGRSTPGPCAEGDDATETLLFHRVWISLGATRTG